MIEVSAPEDMSLESVVARVADEFLARQKQGERPDVEEYAARYPHAAPVLRKVLASLQMLGLSGPADAAGLGMESGEPVTGTLGDFRLLREVGRGGMGVVYEAEQISLGRRVALKVLPFAAAMDAKQLQRFKQEAQAAAHLQHTNIVPVYYVGCERGVHFYAMQYIQGQTLAGVIHELRQLGGPQAATPGAPGSLAGELASGRWAPAPPCRPEGTPTTDYGPAPAADTNLVAAGSTERSTKSPAFFRTVAHLVRPGGRGSGARPSSGGGASRHQTGQPARPRRAGG
jgi:hypothetical protein